MTLRSSQSFASMLTRRTILCEIDEGLKCHVDFQGRKVDLWVIDKRLHH